jgi:hypothetical protein
MLEPWLAAPSPSRQLQPCPDRLGSIIPASHRPEKTHQSCICICCTCQPQPHGTLPVHTSCRSDPASAQARISTFLFFSFVVSLLQVSPLPPRQSHRPGRSLSHGELSCELSPGPSLAKRERERAPNQERRSQNQTARVCPGREEQIQISIVSNVSMFPCLHARLKRLSQPCLGVHPSTVTVTLHSHAVKLRVAS